MGFDSSQLASASAIAQVGGVAANAIGSYFSGASQRSSVSAQATAADVNARLAELGAQSALAQGQQQVGALTLRTGQLKSSQRAAMAANGIDLGTGSAAEVQASTDVMKEIDANTLTANAVRSAWGYRAQAMNFQNEAIARRSTATSLSPAVGAATSLLGGAAGAARSWYEMSKYGDNSRKIDFESLDQLGNANSWWGS